MKTTDEKIQIVKSFLLRNIKTDYEKSNVMDGNKLNLCDEAETIVNLVSISSLGFASDVATTVEKFNKVSEKQAYWIAKATIENNLDSRISFLYE